MIVFSDVSIKIDYTQDPLKGLLEIDVANRELYLHFQICQNFHNFHDLQDY